MKNRKAFNFYRSYYDTLLKLPESDQLSYLKAIIELQFNGNHKVDLSPMADLALSANIHNINRQIEGYKHGVKGGKPTSPNIDPQRVDETTPPKGKANQVQGEVQVEEKEETREEKFLSWFNNQKEKHTGKKGKFKVLSKTDTNNLKKLLDTYSHDDFKEAIPNLFKSEWARTHNGFSPSHFLRIDNFNKFLNQDTGEVSNDPMVNYVKQHIAKYGDS